MARSARKKAKGTGFAEHKKTKDLDKLKHDYGERVKEYNCLNRFSKIVETPNISLNEILERTNHLLPEAWQYPEIACSRIVLEKQQFRTKNFKQANWKQQAPIKVHGKKAGFVEVFYLERKPINAEGPFLLEERQLLDAIAERLGRIIERKKAEEALRESEQRWATTLSSIGDAVIATDAVGKITFMNKVAEKLTRWTLKDAFHKPVKEVFRIINEFTRKEVEDPVSRVVRRGRVASLPNHTVLVRKDGTEVAIDDSGAPIRHRESKTTGVVLVFRDITERRKTEQDRETFLQETVSCNKKLDCLYRLASLVETSEISLDGILQGASDLLSHTYRYPEIVCSRIFFEDKEFKTDNFKESQWKQCAEIKSNGQKIGAIEIYYLQEKPTIDEGPFSMEERSLLDAIAERLGRIIERKKAEKELDHYRMKLEELVEQKTKELKDSERMVVVGQTAGMVGHDIRNPLQAIIGDLYLAHMDADSLTDSSEKESLQESLLSIQKNVDYISKIVGDLQDFAKELEPLAEEIDLKCVVDELLRNHSIPENVQAVVEVAKDAEMLQGDSAYIKRIISNLVMNAVQAMPEGGKLKICVYKDVGGTVITVEDTGIGIPAEARDKLFTPFFTTKSKGQGLGLAVVKRLTEALNGTVTLESQEGKGTRFIVRLPQQENKQ